MINRLIKSVKNLLIEQIIPKSSSFSTVWLFLNGYPFTLCFSCCLLGINYLLQFLFYLCKNTNVFLQMEYLFCPQCGIRKFALRNNAGNSIIVNVNRSLQIIPIKETESADAYNLYLLFCLGFSWQGNKEELKKFTPH